MRQGLHFDCYTEAIAEKERCNMPRHGPSIDRRTFQHVREVYDSERVMNLVCFACGQQKTHADLTIHSGKLLATNVEVDLKYCCRWVCLRVMQAYCS